MLRPGSFALTALLAALTAIGPISTDMYLPSLPALTQGFGTTVAAGQLTISSYLIGFAVGQILYGPLSDRHGRKPVLIGAVMLYCAASIVCTFSVSIEMLIGARFLQALGASGGVVLARAVVRDLHSGARAGRELSLIASVMALAPVLAPMVGGVLQTAFGWQSVFATMASVGLSAVAVVWLLLPETLAERASEAISLGSMAKSYRLVARNPAYLAYTGLATTSYAGLFAWLSTASFVLQNLYGLTPFKFGVVFALGSFGYMTGSTIATRLVMRLGIDGTIGCGCATMTAGGLAMVGAVALDVSSALVLVASVAVYLAGLGLVLPQSLAGALTPFPERAGAASALLGFIQQTMAAVSGVVVGQMLGHSAWPLAIAVALMGSVSLLLWFATIPVRAKAQHQE
ncbi:MAG: multidrug effflux MFS transporter [Pseudolabrys sp.]|jgi:MFS transporter, DHA1 family, multidrug resistance protein